MSSWSHHARASDQPVHAGLHRPGPSTVPDVLRKARFAHVWVVAAKLRARIRGSAWTGLVVRGGSLTVALLILAWIGRASAPARASGVRPDPDAGAASILGASALAPLTPSASSSVPPVMVTATATATSSATPSGRATPSDPVYVNHASAEELRRLPGVGPKRADAILSLRQRVGRFQRMEELLRVKGVGRATLRKWRPLVRLDSPPNAGAAETASVDASRP